MSDSPKNPVYFPMNHKEAVECIKRSNLKESSHPTYISPLNQMQKYSLFEPENFFNPSKLAEKVKERCQNLNTLGNYYKAINKVFEYLTEDQKLNLFEAYAASIESPVDRKIMSGCSKELKLEWIESLRKQYSSTEAERQKKYWDKTDPSKDPLNALASEKQEARYVERGAKLLKEIREGLEDAVNIKDWEKLAYWLIVGYYLADGSATRRLDWAFLKHRNITENDPVSIDLETGVVTLRSSRKQCEFETFTIENPTMLLYIRKLAEERSKQGWDYLYRKSKGQAQNNTPLDSGVEGRSKEQHMKSWAEWYSKWFKNMNKKVFGKDMTNNDFRRIKIIAAEAESDGSDSAKRKIDQMMGNSQKTRDNYYKKRMGATKEDIAMEVDKPLFAEVL